MNKKQIALQEEIDIQAADKETAAKRIEQLEEEKRAILLKVYGYVNRLKIAATFGNDPFPILNELSDYLVSVDVAKTTTNYMSYGRGFITLENTGNTDSNGDCRHNSIVGDNYGESCKLCGKQLAGYGYGGFFGRLMQPGTQCIHDFQPMGEGGARICTYCEQIEEDETP